MEGKDIILDCFRKADLLWWFGLISNYENAKVKEMMIKVIKNVKSDNFSKAFKEGKDGLKSAKTPNEKVLFLEICGNCAYVLGNLEDAEEHYSEGLKNLDEGSMPDKKINLSKAAILGNNGLIVSKTINLDNGLKFFQDALNIYQELGFKMGQACQIANVGLIYFMKGHLQSAFQQIQNALEIDISIEDRAGEGLDLIKLSKIYEFENKFDLAHKCDHDALKIFEELKDNHGIGTALNQEATVFLKKIQLPNAEKLFAQALKINRKIGDKSAIVYALGQIGYIYFFMAYYESAHRPINEALNICDGIGDKYLYAFLTNIKGLITLLNPEGGTGDVYIQKAIEISRLLGTTLNEGIQTHGLGWKFFCDAQAKELLPIKYQPKGSVKELSDKAIQNYEEALKIFKKIDYKYGEANELLHLAKVYGFLKNSDLGLKYLNQALEVAKAVMDRRSEAEILMELGNVLDYGEDPLNSLKYLKESLELIKKIEHKHLEALCLKSMYRVYLQIGNPEKFGLDVEKFLTDLLETTRNCIKAYQEIHMLSDASGMFKELSDISRLMGDNDGANRFKSQADNLDRIYRQECNSTIDMRF